MLDIEKLYNDFVDKQRPLKILILVLSFNEEPFSTLMRTQQNSWDSVEIEGVDTFYYYGGGVGKDTYCHTNNSVFERTNTHYELVLPCGDKYYYMGEKLKLALEFIFENNIPFDYIFRTNSSSYVSKSTLVEFAKTLPKEKLYSGWEFIDSEDFGGGCISGAGIWLTPDTAKILMENIDPNFEQEEDVYCGRILRKHGITAIDDKSRYDVENIHDFIPLDRYHYRCKTGNRSVDAHNMIMLYKKLISQ